MLQKFLNKAYYFTFACDVILFILLLAGKQPWPAALFLTEAVCWFIRLSWLNRSLLHFIVNRVLHMIPILIIVIAIGFLLIKIAPGDILANMRINPDIRPGTIERFEESFGLNDPWYIQFFKYLFNAIQGNFGYSQLYKAEVFAIVSQRAGNTLLLAFISMIAAWAISIPAGIFSAARQYRWQDQLISVFAFIGLAIPNFFLAFLLLYLITHTGGWLPLGGMQSVNFTSLDPFQQFLDGVRHMVVPVLVLATSSMAQLTRIMRANMLEIMSKQYITTARAKGLKESVVINRHALRNAINPMITIFGTQLGALLSGAALTEQVLSWPGLGKLVLEATMAQDLYLVVGSLVYSVVLIMAGNLVADILLALVDPRVRMGK